MTSALTLVQWPCLRSDHLPLHLCQVWWWCIILIIMYIYYALVNVLSTHMIHINLNMIFYTHVEHSPTWTVYIKYYIEKHTRTHARTHTHTPQWIQTCITLICIAVGTLWPHIFYEVICVIRWGSVLGTEAKGLHKISMHAKYGYIRTWFIFYWLT